MKKVLILLFSVFLSVSFLGCSSQLADIVGEVNGDVITRQQFNQQYNIIKVNYESQQSVTLDGKNDKDVIQKLKDQAFSDLVLQKLLWQEAEKKKIKVSKEEIDADLNHIKESQSQEGEDGYEKFLEKAGLNEKQLREQIKTQQLYWKLYNEVTSNVKVSEEEIRNFYDDNLDTFKEHGGIQIYHILVGSETEAEDILAKLNQGEDFSKLASEYSTCPSKENGGDLGLVNETTGFIKEFKEAALRLEPGEITEQPVKTEFGYHIIKAGEKKEERTKAFEEVKNEIMLSLQQEKKYQVFNEYLENLHNSADIKDNRN